MSVPRSTILSTGSFKCAAILLLVSLFAGGCASVSPVRQHASLSLSASAFNFQTVAVGQTVTQTLLISNTGTATLQISALSVSNREFSISGPAVPRALLPASSLTYTLAFSPTSAGSAAATLNITCNTASATASISLVGSGGNAFADLVITPPSINFGNLALRSTSTQTVILKNTGDINVSLQGVTVAGGGFGYSGLSPGLSLAPNQQVTFQVWFSPIAAGPSSAAISLLSPNLSSPATLSLTGDGTSSSAAPASPAAVQHTVQLTWNPSSSQVIGYRVYRSEVSGGPYSAMNGAAIDALAYDDATVASGTTYYYVVIAVDASGAESIDSNQVTAVVPSP